MQYRKSDKISKLELRIIIVVLAVPALLVLLSFYGVVLGLIVGGTVIFFTGFEYLRQNKVMMDTPTSKIRGMAMGPVEVYGQVVPVEGVVLKSPITEHDCVYYDFAVMERQGKHFGTIIEGEKAVEFFLQDETGKVLVDSKGAKLDMPPKMEITTGSLLSSERTDEINRFLSKHKIGGKNLLGFENQMYFLEYYIGIGEKLYVMGTAGDNPYIDESSADKSAADVMIQKGNGDYYISNKSEKDVAGAMKLNAWAGLSIGALMTLAGLAFTFLVFGML